MSSFISLDLFMYLFSIYVFIYHPCFFVCVCDVFAHTCRSSGAEDNLWELVLSFYHESQGSNASGEAWRQAPLPPEPTCWILVFFFKDSIPEPRLALARIQDECSL